MTSEDNKDLWELCLLIGIIMFFGISLQVYAMLITDDFSKNLYGKFPLLIITILFFAFLVNVGHWSWKQN